MTSSFAARLQRLLGSLKATAKDIENVTGIPQRTIQSYLRGEREPNTEALEKISRTGVNLNWLVSGEGEMFLRSWQDAENLIVERHIESACEGRKDIDDDAETRAKLIWDVGQIEQSVRNYNDSENEIIWNLFSGWVRHYVPHLTHNKLMHWLEEHEKHRSAMKDAPIGMKYYPVLMGRITEAIKVHYAEWFNDLGEKGISHIQEMLYSVFYKLGATNEKLPDISDILAALAVARKLGSVSRAPNDPA